MPVDAALRVVRPRRLRGDIKLSHALDGFAVPVDARVAVDIGASAGGFTTALLDRGAQRVYAVDVGIGQLVGRLRADPRVVNLEGHNLAELSRRLIPDVVGIVTMDISYLPLAEALTQLDGLALEAHADLVVLVKPTFELRAATLVRDAQDVRHAVAHVAQAMTGSGWHVRGQSDAPATGRHGAPEVFLHGRKP